jgi:hypothetical protein|tara:strand:- start:7262 stop:7717 length:456 start_codon:yes stop_codon:yes gene_type:complete
MGTKRVGWARIRSLINENQNDLYRQKAAIKSVTSDTTLVAAESGKVILMGQNGVDITLPAATAGMTFTIIQVEDFLTAVCTVVAAAGDFMAGAVAGPSAAAANLADGSANLTATFGSATLAGDQITLLSDGTLWYVTGTAAAGGANGIAFS